MNVSPYTNKSSLQLVDIHVNDSGEYFGFPLEYVYICPECNGIIRSKEYKVASTNNKIPKSRAKLQNRSMARNQLKPEPVFAFFSSA